VLTLADAVWRLCGQPAQLFGVKDRGALKPGHYADLLLFDPATVDRGPARRVFDLPGGNPRLTTSAVGVHGVWVNGVRIAGRDGTFGSNVLPGRLLREFAA
jgi:N-acyl-D-aspartate/D-glutamate deacylase